MRNARMDEIQAGIKIAGRNINNLRYPDDTTLTAESEEELKSLLMNVKEESEKAGLKLNIQKTEIMASSTITSWWIEGGRVEAVTDFIFLASQITANGDCSHEIKRCLLLGRKAMTNLDSVLKCRDITLPAKVCLVKAMVFPVVVYACESWTIRKAECQSIGASASASVFPMSIQDWFPLEWTGLISLQSKGLSRVFFNTTVQKHQFFSLRPSLWSNSHIHTWLLEKP